MAALNHRVSPAAEQGYVLLLTLITLIILLFGALFTVRGTLLQTIMTGNTLQRQKGVQVSDAAIRQIQQLIVQTAQGAGNVPLEIAANGKPWFYIPPTTTPATRWDPPGASTGANAKFWETCASAGTCDTVSDAAQGISPIPPSLPAGYSALVTVVPTNLPADAYSCGNTGYIATYYDIFLNTQEQSGTTRANTETVFKLCTPA